MTGYAPIASGSAVEILDLRHFSSADLRPLLEQESQVWSRMLSWDYSSSAEMILRYVDAKILPGYAAVEKKKVFGYAFFVYEGAKGVIGDLFVAEPPARSPAFLTHRKTEAAAPSPPEWGDGMRLEHRLLTHVIETLQQSPGIHRVEAQLLVHDTGVVSAPFLAQGFRRHPRLFMVLPLRGEQAPPRTPASIPHGVEIRKWAETDFQGAAACITASYRDHIDSDINDQYRTISGSLRFLNNIVRFPGCGIFDTDASFVACHRGTRTLIGLILCSRVKSDVGHITQVCLLPEYRGRGIGEALIASSYLALRKRNFASLSLTVTEANGRAVDLYRRIGFDVKRVFDAFVWEG